MLLLLGELLYLFPFVYYGKDIETENILGTSNRPTINRLSLIFFPPSLCYGWRLSCHVGLGFDGWVVGLMGSWFFAHYYDSMNRGCVISARDI